MAAAAWTQSQLCVATLLAVALMVGMRPCVAESQLTLSDSRWREQKSAPPVARRSIDSSIRPSVAASVQMGMLRQLQQHKPSVNATLALAGGMCWRATGQVCPDDDTYYLTVQPGLTNGQPYYATSDQTLFLYYRRIGQLRRDCRSGDGTGGTEEYVGDASDAEACIEMVAQQRPDANGATYEDHRVPAQCYAEFGMSGWTETNAWSSCMLLDTAGAWVLNEDESDDERVFAYLISASPTGTGGWTQGDCPDVCSPLSVTEVVDVIWGCTDPTAGNFSPEATASDGSCIADLRAVAQTLALSGRLCCSDTLYFQLQPELVNGRPHYATRDHKWFLYWIEALPSYLVRFTSIWVLADDMELLSPTSSSNPTISMYALIASTSLVVPDGVGEWSEIAWEHGAGATLRNNPALAVVEVPHAVWGCTYSTAVNFRSTATADDGSCDFDEAATLLAAFDVDHRDQEAWTKLTRWSLSVMVCRWQGIECDARSHVKMIRLHSLDVRFTLNDELGSLKGLQELSIYGASLSGTIPNAVVDMPTLQVVRASSTYLSGTIPPRMGDLGVLWNIDFSNTKLSGSIPIPIQTSTRLRELLLSNTLISGTLGGAMGSSPLFPELIHADLHSCRLSGTVPDFENHRSMHSLNLGGNVLERLPSFLPASLSHVYLGGNPLNSTTSQLSALTSQLPNLKVLSVSLIGLPVVLDYTYGHPCSLQGQYGLSQTDTHGCYGTRIAPPVECTVGSQCSWVLWLYDAYDRPVVTGGLLIDRLHIGINCTTDLTRTVQTMDGHTLRDVELRVAVLNSCQQQAAMADNGDGSFTATTGASWVQHEGEHSVRFFDGQNEFLPERDVFNAPASYDVLRTTRFVSPIACDEATMQLQDGRCVCRPGFALAYESGIDGTGDGNKCQRCVRWAICPGGTNATQTYCPKGQEANVDQLDCVMCANGRAGGGESECFRCPAGTTPVADRSACECERGFYNSSFGRIICHDRDYINETEWLLSVLTEEDGSVPAEYVDVADDVLWRLAAADVPVKYRSHAERLKSDAAFAFGRCLPCPRKGCARCAGGSAVAINPGWTVAPQDTASYAGLAGGPLGVEKNLYRCPLASECETDMAACREACKMECALDAECIENCIHGDANQTSGCSPAHCMCLGESLRPGASLCNASHHGTVCAVCTGENSVNVSQQAIGGTDQMCQSCVGHHVTNWVGVLGTVAVVSVIYVTKRAFDTRIRPKLAKWRSMQSRMKQAQKVRAITNVLVAAIPGDREPDHSGWWSGTKVIVSNYQILHHLPDVLARTFPPALQGFVAQLAPFNLEFFQAFDLRCSISIGLYGRFIRTMCLPVATYGAVILLCLAEASWLRRKQLQTKREMVKTIIDSVEKHKALFPEHIQEELQTTMVELEHIVSHVEPNDEAIRLKMNDILEKVQPSTVIQQDSGPIERAVSRALATSGGSEIHAVRPEGLWDAAKPRALVAIFLLYPSLNNAIFRVLTCRQFDGQWQVAYNVYDYSVDCTTRTYVFFWWVAMCFLMLYSVGIPCFFFLLLYRDRRSNGDTREPEEQPRLRASLVAPASNPSRSNNLGFMTKEYKPQYYWFELVEYTKKLMMTGVLMKAAQGSISQIFFGLIISFLYFALVARCMPYRDRRVNVIRIVGELQLFLTMLCVLMLRVDLHEEWITKDRVTFMLFLVNFVLSPVPFVYDTARRTHRFANDLHSLLAEMKKTRADKQWSQQQLTEGEKCCDSKWICTIDELKLLLSETSEFLVGLEEDLEKKRKASVADAVNSAPQTVSEAVSEAAQHDQSKKQAQLLAGVSHEELSQAEVALRQLADVSGFETRSKSLGLMNQHPESEPENSHSGGTCDVEDDGQSEARVSHTPNPVAQ